MSAVILNPLPETDVFARLRESDQQLTLTVQLLHEACVELAAKNGDGEHIRRRIRRSLIVTRGTSNGPSR